MSKEFKKEWTVNVPKDQTPELLGEIIDVFEDFLAEKGIPPYMIPNPERDEDEDECAAIIYGDDYDNLADHIASILGIDR